MDAYLDIKTTGLSPHLHRITVVGVLIGPDESIIQLVGDDICAERLTQILQPVSNLYTYNGTRFDLPFLRLRLGLELIASLQHHDLMFDCWKIGLYGGLKAVEMKLGIPRQLSHLNGYAAIRLWKDYQNHQDQEALRLLTEYNREDVLNLKLLRNALMGLPIY